jgi:hypothetical protein
MGGDFRKIDKRGMDEIISYHNVVTATPSISRLKRCLRRFVCRAKQGLL